MSFTAIKEIVSESLEDAINFDDFALNARENGVTQVTLDLLKREHTYYDADGAYLVDPLPKAFTFTVLSRFDQEKIIEALSAFDNQKISPRVFMEKLAQAGVMLAIAFFNERRALYIGRSGEFYLELWA